MIPIFVTLVEVRPLPGCEIDPEEYNGASVRCYIPAQNEAEARSLFKSTLDEGFFELMDEEFFVQEDLVKWENPESEEADKAMAEARSSGEVIFSDFVGWGHDDPDAYPAN